MSVPRSKRAKRGASKAAQGDEKDARIRELEARVAELESGSEKARTEAAAAITEAKQAEAALRATNLQLTEADERKHQVLALLSQELRNPLAPIKNSLYVLAVQPRKLSKRSEPRLSLRDRSISSPGWSTTFLT